MVRGVRLPALLILAAIEVGGAFGGASVKVDEVAGESAVVDIEVEVRTSVQAVIAHLAFEEDPAIALPLLDRGGGVFSIRTELAAKNYIVVFEAVGTPDGTSAPHSLEDLGAEFPSASGGSPRAAVVDEDALSSESKRLLWLAVALGAGSLSALAFWVLGGRSRGKHEEGEE